MNQKKNIVMILVVLWCGASIQASEQSDTKKSFFSNDRVAKGCAIAAGCYLIYTGFQCAWNKYYQVEAKVDRVQKTCKSISSDQKKMSAQITGVDSKVIAVQNTATTILNDQNKLGNRVEQVKTVVDENGKKLTTLELQLSGLGDKTESHFSQTQQEFDSVKTVQTQHTNVLRVLELAQKEHASTLDLIASIQKKYDHKLDAVIATQTEHSVKLDALLVTQGQHSQEFDAIKTQIKNGHNEHMVELKRQGELLASHTVQLKKIESKADRTKRRIKSLFNSAKKTTPDMEDVSDSDEEVSEPLSSTSISGTTTEKLLSLDVKKQSQTQTPV